MKDKLKKIDNKYVRLIALIIVVLNGSLQFFNIDFLPFSSEEITKGVSIAGIVIVTTWNFWKNNSFTEAAQQSDRWLHIMKKRIKREKKMFD